MRTSIDEHTMILLLGMQSLLLLEEDKGCTSTERNGKDEEARYKAKDAVGDDEAENGSTNGTGCPGDVATLKPHKFKGLLQSLEHWVANVFVVFCSCCHSVYLRLNLL